MHKNLWADLPAIGPDQPVLIAGPTASGKSALALAIAEQSGGVIINADASQVFDCWRVITARPSAAEEARAPHRLYGHLPYDAPYSVGHWLRELAPLVSDGPRPIIVGGTGLYFRALTQGLADIPPVPADIRAQADQRALADMLAALDPATAAIIATDNRARVQRAYEVQQATGRGLAAWHADPQPALLPLDRTVPLVLDAPKSWLTDRINRRFDAMLAAGALDEVAAMRDRYDPALPSCRAIGVPEVMAHLTAGMTLDQAREKATIATRQFAKRQRTWFRSKMADWHWVSAAKG